MTGTKLADGLDDIVKYDCLVINHALSCKASKSRSVHALNCTSRISVKHMTAHAKKV